GAARRIVLDIHRHFEPGDFGESGHCLEARCRKDNTSKARARAVRGAVEQRDLKIIGGKRIASLIGHQASPATSGAKPTFSSTSSRDCPCRPSFRTMN